MDPVRSPFRLSKTRKLARQPGFGLIEAMISAVILIVGLAALAGLFAQSLTFLQYTREDLIAKQKAREALEAVYSARNDGTIGFVGIQNTNNRGGIFLGGFQPLFLPGPERPSWERLDKRLSWIARYSRDPMASSGPRMTNSFH